MKYSIQTTRPITADGQELPGVTEIATLETDLSPSMVMQMVRAGQATVELDLDGEDEPADDTDGKPADEPAKPAAAPKKKPKPKAKS